MGFTGERRRDIGVGTMDGLIVGRHFASGSTAGQSVNKTTAATIPTVHRAFSFGANAVANLTLGVWRGEGVVPERVSNTISARLFAGVPNDRQDWFRFWYTVEKSLESRNNAYVWKTKDAAGRVVQLTALHPDQVFPYLYQVRQSELQYPVMMSPFYPTPPGVDGYGVVTVDRGTIWHIRGDGGTGEMVPPSPITTFATTLGIALAKQDYEANTYANGVFAGLGVTFPAGMTLEQARQWKDMFDSTNAGTSNAGATKAIGGGATISQVGMTPADAQFVEAGHMSTLDVCNMTGIPKWVLGADDKSDKAKPEQDEARWVHHGLRTRLRRIESSLYAEPDIFGAGSRDYPMFDTADVIHPDSLTADGIAHQQIQDGRMLVDEWRLSRGLPPLPGGIGMIPQVTPVGGAPNPVMSMPIESE